jgi:hypothetical protein
MVTKSLPRPSPIIPRYVACSIETTLLNNPAFCRSKCLCSMMIIIFWEMTPCGTYKNRHFGGSYRLHLQGEVSYELCLYKSLQLRSVTCSHSCTLKMEAIQSSEMSVLIRATRCHLPEDDNHHSHRRGNLKSYMPV